MARHVRATTTAPNPSERNRLQVARRRRAAVDLRIKGWSLERIKNELGFKTCAGVENAINTHIRSLPKGDLKQIQHLEMSRLDGMLEVAYEKATDEGNLFAMDRVIAMMERRAKYLGLDSTQQTQDNSMVDAWVTDVAGASQLDGVDYADLEDILDVSQEELDEVVMDLDEEME